MMSMWKVVGLAVATVMGSVLIVGSVMLWLGQRREAEARRFVAANMAGILKSVNVYANDNDDDFPTVAPPLTMPATSMPTTFPAIKLRGLESAIRVYATEYTFPLTQPAHPFTK